MRRDALEPTGTRARWLDDRALAAVLLRPERYIALSIPQGAQAITANVPGWRNWARGHRGVRRRPEAQLRDHVRDETGKTREIVSLGLDVHAQPSKLSRYGVAAAFEG